VFPHSLAGKQEARECYNITQSSNEKIAKLTFGGSAPILTSQFDQLKVFVMREIQASDAKARLPQLLDEVERGETLLITRHGRPIARIVPESERRQEEIDRAILGIKAIQQRTGRISAEDLMSARHEGHKY